MSLSDIPIAILTGYADVSMITTTTSSSISSGSGSGSGSCSSSSSCNNSIKKRW